MQRTAVAVAALVAQILSGAAGAEEPPWQPGSIAGLTAWYRADGLASANGQPIAAWQDDSGGGHDLIEDKAGLSAIFSANQQNGLPAVQVRKGGTYSMTDPFTLTDHTIFLVYAAGAVDRALFRSRADEFQGLMLRSKGTSDRLQYGGLKSTAYGSAGIPLDEYGLTVLGRQGDLLRSFVNGAEVSASGKVDTPIEVGRFFDLALTRFVRASGDKLRIAEMLFFDRWLPDAERERVASYLVGKYALLLTAGGAAPAAVAPAAAASASPRVAQLSSTAKLNVNDGQAVVPWDVEDVLDEPFRHDRSADSSRLLVASGPLRVRLYVSLPLVSAVPDTAVRVMFRVNGAAFLRGEGRTGRFGRAGAPDMATARAEVIATLEAGDYVEVVTVREGAEGTVTIEPGSAVFIAETR